MSGKDISTRKIFKCQLCEKEFTSNQSLQYHLESSKCKRVLTVDEKFDELTKKHEELAKKIKELEETRQYINDKKPFVQANNYKYR